MSYQVVSSLWKDLINLYNTNQLKPEMYPLRVGNLRDFERRGMITIFADALSKPELSNFLDQFNQHWAKYIMPPQAAAPPRAAPPPPPRAAAPPLFFPTAPRAAAPPPPRAAAPPPPQAAAPPRAAAPLLAAEPVDSEMESAANIMGQLQYGVRNPIQEKSDSWAVSGIPSMPRYKQYGRAVHPSQIPVYRKPTDREKLAQLIEDMNEYSDVSYLTPSQLQTRKNIYQRIKRLEKKLGLR